MILLILTYTFYLKHKLSGFFLQQSTQQKQHSALDDVEVVKFQIIRKIAYYALIVHMALILIFSHVGAPILAIANFFSVLAWGAGIFLINQQQNSIALRIFCAEVVIHSVLACSTLGMDAGFQFYLWTISCLMLIDYKLKLKRALIYSLVLVLSFAGLYLLFGSVTYNFTYPDLLPYVKTTNIIIAGLPMIYGVGLIRELAISQRLKLTDMAARDHLTKLYNRRFAKPLIIKAHRQSIEEDEKICLVMADIDYFKRINDTYGHDKGDKILVTIADTLSTQLSEDDIAVRWGGEEFLIALINTNEQQALQKVEKIRLAIQSLTPYPEENDLTITMSFGLIEWQPLAAMDKMLQLADKALYESKNNGRNKTTIAQPFANMQLELEQPSLD